MRILSAQLLIMALLGFSAQAGNGTSSSSFSPKLKQFMIDHPEASMMLTNIASTAFSNRTFQVVYCDDSEFPSYHFYPTDSLVVIAVRKNQQASDEFLCVVFEMLNSGGESRFNELKDMAKAGKISKEGYVKEVMLQEFQATRKMRDLLGKLRLNDKEIAESYLYNKAVHCPSDFGEYSKSVPTNYLQLLEGNYEKAQTNAAFFYRVASSAFDACDYTGAITNFTRVIELNPRSANAYCGRGMSKWWLQDYGGAIADYDKAIVLEPQCAGFYCNRGQARFSLKMVPEALVDYNKSIELDPQNAQAYYNRGTLQMICFTNCTAAAADFSKAIEIGNDPHQEDIFFWRGNARLQVQNYTGAIADYTKALELNPSNAYARTNRDAAIQLSRESRKR